MCAEGHTSACLTTNPGQAGAAYGYPNKGGYQGAQTEFLRVPFGDANCLKLPGEPGDAWEEDFVLLADAFATGHHATAIIDVGQGDTVVVFGAGATGRIFRASSRSGTGILG
jgi:glutathione-independent formaldehyde dehydrogenase